MSNNNNETPSPEQILSSISAMRDSVWVISDEISKENITKQNVQTVQRNVSHLEIVMSSEYVTGSGEDLSDLTTAIEDGNAFIELHSSLLTE
jgi:hypothetical protein